MNLYIFSVKATKVSECRNLKKGIFENIFLEASY